MNLGIGTIEENEDEVVDGTPIIRKPLLRSKKYSKGLKNLTILVSDDKESSTI